MPVDPVKAFRLDELVDLGGGNASENFLSSCENNMVAVRVCDMNSDSLGQLTFMSA
jgi:hypothetical protein